MHKHNIDAIIHLAVFSYFHCTPPHNPYTRIYIYMLLVLTLGKGRSSTIHWRPFHLHTFKCKGAGHPPRSLSQVRYIHIRKCENVIWLTLLFFTSGLKSRRLYTPPVVLCMVAVKRIHSLKRIGYINHTLHPLKYKYTRPNLSRHHHTIYTPFVELFTDCI